MFERAETLTLAVLRSHFLLEQSMGDYIIASGKKAKWVEKPVKITDFGEQ